MRRREFIAGLGSAAAWPMVARGQQSETAVVGLLSAGAQAPYSALMPSFHRGLRTIGYVVGTNVAIVERYASGDFNSIPELASGLTRQGAAVIVTTGTTSALAAKAGAPGVPLVFLSQVDPVIAGLVASLSRPGGNATGIYVVTADLISKRLDFARQVAPDRSLIAIMLNPKGAEIQAQVQEIEVAKATGDAKVQVRILNASNPREIESAFASVARPKPGALIIGSDPLFFSRRDQIVALTRREAIPAIYDRREYVTAGGLMSYGTHLADAFERLGIYAGKILKGARPAEIPVEQAARFEFVVNLKTARTLGLVLPANQLALADEVIE